SFAAERKPKFRFLLNQPRNLPEKKSFKNLLILYYFDFIKFFRNGRKFTRKNVDSFVIFELIK
uniref:Uncharacterized protein n=1 Tax=Romanomermis culicivorax TaxID=13658 RepID=A0A915I308_ROMCU